MQTELSGWDFEKTIADAKAAWNKELNKVKVYTTDEASKKIFYTSLYHTLFAPSEFCDVNGDYYGADKQMHKDEGFVNYTTFSSLSFSTLTSSFSLPSSLRKISTRLSVVFWNSSFSSSATSSFRESCTSASILKN